MSAWGLVFLHEIRYRLGRKSFLFVTFGLPLVAAALFWGIARLDKSPLSQPVVRIVSGPPRSRVSGIVDQVGVVESIPAEAAKEFRLFADEAQAQAALRAGEIRRYFLLSPEFVRTGIGTVVTLEENLSDAVVPRSLQELLLYNLTAGDRTLAERLIQPLRLSEQSLASAAPQRERAHPLTFFIPYAVMMVFYLEVFSTATILLGSLNRERENELLEVLLVGLPPKALLSGKILGVGLLGLLQTGVWIGTGYGLLRAGGRVYRLPPAFQLPPGFLAWGLVYFLLGYAVYGSLMAGLGALVPDVREASQYSILVGLPLMVPPFLVQVLSSQPDGWLAVTLSLFPLTAPEVMMTRLSTGAAPTWQLVLGALLMALTAWGIVLLAARLFQAQILLTGRSFRLRRWLTRVVRRKNA